MPALTDAAIIASASAVKSVAELIRYCMEGATPQQREKMWQWYIDDMTRWRKFWGLED